MKDLFFVVVLRDYFCCLLLDDVGAVRCAGVNSCSSWFCLLSMVRSGCIAVSVGSRYGSDLGVDHAGNGVVV